MLVRGGGDSAPPQEPHQLSTALSSATEAKKPSLEIFLGPGACKSSVQHASRRRKFEGAPADQPSIANVKRYLAPDEAP
jgi:hypothetical protein